MAIRLRPSADGDYDFLWWLHGATMRTYVDAIWGWDESLQRHYFQEHFDPACTEVIEREGEAVGCISVERREECLCLGLIEIAPDFQGQGMGTDLIRDLQDEARGRGVPLKLRVLQGNPARRLYERLGFVAAGETETHITMSWQPQIGAANDRGEPR
jgi:predicted N-acetyltransferase YhbS